MRFLFLKKDEMRKMKLIFCFIFSTLSSTTIISSIISSTTIIFSSKKSQKIIFLKNLKNSLKCNKIFSFFELDDKKQILISNKIAKK